MVLEDGSFILKTGTARGIFSFGGEEILIYHSETQIQALGTNKPSTLALRKEGRKEGNGKEKKRKSRQGLVLSIGKDLEQLELSYWAGCSTERINTLKSGLQNLLRSTVHIPYNPESLYARPAVKSNDTYKNVHSTIISIR